MGRLLAQCKLICIQKAHAPDHRNRLVRVVDNGKAVEYDYDYRNRLVRRNDELFVHDGWQVACSLKNSKIEHRYLWGAVQDELITADDNWTLRDHLNTVRKVVNMKGKVVSHLEYNAFGKLVSSTGDRPLFRYTGKMFDDATGLQWNINRWYDANVGRWIGEDPIGFRGKDVNLKRYVGNSPLIFFDIQGFSARDTFLQAFNQGVSSAVSFGETVLQFADMFNIFSFLITLQNNLWSYPYTFQFGQTPDAEGAYNNVWNTFTFPPDVSGHTAVHEAAHGYNDTVLGFWSKDADEALAYMLDYVVLLLGVSTTVSQWEERIFSWNEGCPVGDEKEMRRFMNKWNFIWPDVDSALANKGITVEYWWGKSNRPLTEQDYLNLETHYGIRISCEAYKDWSLDTIEKRWGKTCNTECIKLTCPDTLWSVFQ